MDYHVDVFEINEIQKTIKKIINKYFFEDKKKKKWKL